GELALRQLAGGGDAPLYGLGKAAFTLEMRPELAVTDGAHRGMASGEVVPAVERPHLIEESGGHHRVEAAGEALMQQRAAARGECPGFERHARERAHSSALQFRQPSAGRETNLQSPLNSLAVVGADARRRLGIQTPELGVKR